MSTINRIGTDYFTKVIILDQYNYAIVEFFVRHAVEVKLSPMCSYMFWN